MSGGRPIPQGGVTSEVEVTAQMLRDRNFEKLEHITVKVWITHGRRGDVEVELVSPKGIKSVLAGQRKYDQDEKGFPGWRFMTLKHWEEDPVGKWTIRVSDQNTGAHNGSFLGWDMTLFGSVIDPAKVELWTVPDDPQDPNETPPPASTTSTTSTISTTSSTAESTSMEATKTGTKQHPKPTDHLPDDHHEAEGEAHKPTFGNKTTSATPTPTTPVPVDEGYFAHMTDLLKSQTWLFAALGAVVVFIIGVGIYFYRRRRQRRHYAALGGDDVPMSQVGGTRELYDAFGELSDGDGSDADEEMALRPRDHDAVRYHDGFLDDEEDERERGERYVDVPDERTPSGTGARSPGEESGSGASWEHASQTLTR
ncbi:hypothetical protein BN14_05082 [Rhizoctonia solani AG-1 IB]|nr:hypothetical protein BN14_05082 [Rhizoctonia solani AG-1 IB]